jgi:hypothetical protein
MGSDDEALRYFARRDLLDEKVGPAHSLWELPQVLRILRKQQGDGSWPRSGKPKHAAINYRLIETWRYFRILVDQYGMTKGHPQCEKAAEYLFSCQTRSGDIRGMLADQYATYYSGAILALLIRAGYEGDPRVARGLRWLLSMRQEDGGWTIPILTRYLDRATLYRVTSEHADPIEPDRTEPFSHHWTGMVLRAFAAHPRYRALPEVHHAAELLKSRFFQPDSYGSYRAVKHWLRFEYPFWWNNLVSALDTLSELGDSASDPAISEALRWLVQHQERSGMWNANYAAPNARESARSRGIKPWITLAICRIFRRLGIPGSAS